MACAVPIPRNRILRLTSGAPTSWALTPHHCGTGRPETQKAPRLRSLVVAHQSGYPGKRMRGASMLYLLSHQW